MKTQMILALAITALTLVGLLVLPSVYHFALAFFGLGCAGLAMAFALLIATVENK